MKFGKRGEDNGLLMHVAVTENILLYRAEEKLTAFLELQSATRAAHRTFLASS